MNFRKFLTFSAVICALFFLSLALRYDSWSLLQRFMAFTEGLAGFEAGQSINWSQAFYLMAAFIGPGALLLYFLAKNLSAIIYGGIFAAYLVLVIVLITALIL